MIVGPLKSNLQVSIITLILLCAIAWIGTFAYVKLDSSAVNYKEHILFYYIFGEGISFTLNQIITLIVILTGAFFVNFLCIEQEITSKTNYLPAFFYILLAFSSTTKNIIEPILIANLFVLPSLYFLISSYRQDYALAEFFKAGLFMGLASFFCIHYIVVFPLSFISLIIFRPFNWREWSVLLLGLITPLYIYLGICYLTIEDYLAVFSMMKEATSSIQKPIVSEYYFGFIFITILTFVFGLIRYLGKGFGGKVKTQKTKYVLLWMLLFCLVIMLFEQVSDMILLPCIIPLSIFIGDYLAEVKQLKVANTLLIIFLGAFTIIYLHALEII